MVGIIHKSSRALAIVYPSSERPAQLLSTMASPAVPLPNPTNPPLPSDAPSNDNTITQAGFKVTTRKLPILKAGPIEEMTEKLGIAPPEMIFGDNLARIEHPASGWSIEFNAFDALDRVDKTGDSMLKVSYSKEWQQNR